MNLLLHVISLIMDWSAWAALMSFLFCPAIIFNHKYYFCLSGAVLVSAYFKYIDPSDTLIMIPFFLFPVILILIFERTNRFRKIIGSFSILLFLLVLGMIPMLLLSGFDVNPDYTITAAYLVVDILIIRFCRKNRDRPAYGVKFSAFDILACLILLLFNIIIMVLGETPETFGLDSLNTLSPLVRLIVATTVFLNIFFLISFIKDKTSAYYRIANQRNLRYMEDELKYFQNYRDSQTEMRRYRHDMKNHFLCLQALCKERKYEAIEDYIDQLFSGWQEADSIYHTGDDIVDSILNGKAPLLTRQGISLTVSGHFGNTLPLEPLDICTIFANAIDNAAEANEKVSDLNQRYLKISIKSSQNYYIITFANPITVPVMIDSSMIIPSSKTGEHHGFGLRNIKLTAQKYQGYIALKTENNIFTLEVVLPH